MTDLFDLTGKVALVSGVGGIGRALALGIAEQGADVIVADLRLDNLAKTAVEIRSLGRQTLTLTVDVSQEQSVGDMVTRTLDVFGRIDILVNAFGITNRKPADSFPISEWQKVMDVNTRGTFLCCQAVGRVMIKQRSGKIINMSSVRGRYGLPAGQAAYCPSKGAVDTLTKTLACEWARYNVLVNALAPTVVETDFTRDSLSDTKSAQELKARIPLGRWAVPEDIVGPALFLASKASDFVTGQIIYVDGGATTW